MVYPQGQGSWASVNILRTRGGADSFSRFVQTSFMDGPLSFFSYCWSMF